MSASAIKHDNSRIFHSVIVAFLTVCFSIGANAQELDANIIPILKQLGLKEERVYMPLVVQKTLPYAKNQSVIVIPKIAKKYADCDSCFDFDAYIVIAENGKLISKFYEPKAWFQNVLALGISIDTAPYILNSSTRAFGVRAGNRSNSRAYIADNSDISLFIPQGRTLTRVLRYQEIYSYRGDWDGTCDGEFSSREGTISVEKEKTNGFANLTIKMKRTWRVNQMVEDGCEENEVSMNTSKTLKFDGQEYK